jgi:hypothetical protein
MNNIKLKQDIMIFAKLLAKKIIKEADFKQKIIDFAQVKGSEIFPGLDDDLLGILLGAGFIEIAVDYARADGLSYDQLTMIIREYLNGLEKTIMN